MKILIAISVVVLSVVGVLFYTVKWSAFGSNPHGKHLTQIMQSPQYSSKHASFINPHQEVIDKMYEQINYWEMFQRFFFGKEIRKPNKTLPHSHSDLTTFMEPTGPIKFIWLGHSTFLVNIQGTIVLFDPVFSQSISPISLFAQRFQAPAIQLDQLPPVDYIVISHDHFDHLEVDTIKFLKNTKTKFITPLGVSSHIESWGIPKERLTELDWWQSISFNGVDFICTPAQHFSGRITGKENKTLWASWVVRSSEQSLFYSGDTGYSDHFKVIGDRLGPFDVAFIENGQYDEKWFAVHMLPEESAQAFLDVKGKNYVPVHWGMFELSFHNWFDPIEAIVSIAEQKGINLLTPQIGETVEVYSDQIFAKWWKPYLPDAILHSQKELNSSGSFN